MCTVLLPPGVKPIAVNKYINEHLRVKKYCNKMCITLQYFGFIKEELIKICHGCVEPYVPYVLL